MVASPTAASRTSLASGRRSTRRAAVPTEEAELEVETPEGQELPDIDRRRLECFEQNNDRYYPISDLPSGFNSYIYRTCKIKSGGDDNPLGCNYVVKVVDLSRDATKKFKEEVKLAQEAGSLGVNAPVYRYGTCSNPNPQAKGRRKQRVPGNVGWILMRQLVGNRLSDIYVYPTWTIGAAAEKYLLLYDNGIVQHDLKGDNIIIEGEDPYQENESTLFIIDYGVAETTKQYLKRTIRWLERDDIWQLGKPIPGQSKPRAKKLPRGQRKPPGLAVTREIQRETTRRIHMRDQVAELVDTLTINFGIYSSTEPDPWAKDPNKFEVLIDLLEAGERWYDKAFNVPSGRYAIFIKEKEIPADLRDQYKRWMENRPGELILPEYEYWN